MPKSYSDAEVHEILKRALARQTNEQITHDELVEAAGEVGIPPDQIEAAAAEFGAERELRTRRDVIVGQRRRRFYGAFAQYAAVNAGLAAIDWASGPGWWVHWVIIGWGIAIAIRAVRAFAPTEESITRQIQRDVAREDRKRRHSERQQRVGRTRREFEVAVESGVTALLDIIGRRLHDATSDRAPKERLRVGSPPEEVPTPASRTPGRREGQDS